MLVWSGCLALGIFLTQYWLVHPFFLMLVLCSLPIAMWGVNQFRWGAQVVPVLSCVFMVALGNLRVQQADWSLIPTNLQPIMQGWGEALAHRLDSMPVDQEVSSLLKAMLLGQRQDLDAQVRLLYAQVGASHVLALSGLHLGILFGMLNSLMIWWVERDGMRWGLGIASMLVMWLYVMVTGCPLSLVRSAVMLSLFQLSFMRQCGYSKWHTYGMAALIILLFTPSALFDVGFQLSFASVAGIFLFYKPLCQNAAKEPEMVQRLWRAIVLPLSAQLGSFPLVAYYFHQVSVSSVLLGPIYVALASLILLSGVALLLLGAWVAVVPALFVGLQHGLMRMVVFFPPLGPLSLDLNKMQVMMIYIAILYMVPVLHQAIPKKSDWHNDRARRVLRAWPWWLTSVLCACLTMVAGRL